MHCIIEQIKYLLGEIQELSSRIQCQAKYDCNNIGFESYIIIFRDNNPI